MPGTSTAQLPTSLSSEAKVSLLIIYPGQPIYTAFGHSALRFRDDSTGVDVVFNYGTFDDSDPLFIPKFIYGKMDYTLSANRTRDVIAGWRQVRRSVVQQELRLAPDFKATLYARILENYLPENRTYRYDFLFANCATILLDLLREANGLRFDSSNVVQESFRELLQPYIDQRAFSDAGIALALGSTVDRKTTYEERSFLPLELMELVSRASIDIDGSGARSDLLVVQDTLLWTGTGFTRTSPYPWLAILAWILVITLIGIGIVRPVSESKSARFDRILFGILGCVGILLGLLWFATAQKVTAANWDLAWALPFHVIPAFAWSKLSATTRQIYFAATFAILVALLLLQPFISQSLHPVYLPVVVLAAWRSFLLARTKS
ncbi:MAG: DUF4105 domain-containing protein [Rhodothermia bacterium]|nr:MAG: DUF4105 domain-containing protein [Rhodothermia bacterium]